MCYQLSLIIRELQKKGNNYGFSRICKPVMLENQTVKPIWPKKVTNPFLKCYRLGVNGYRGFKLKVYRLLKKHG